MQEDFRFETGVSTPGGLAGEPTGLPCADKLTNKQIEFDRTFLSNSIAHPQKTREA
jgi:hypothetical protein